MGKPHITKISRKLPCHLKIARQILIASDYKGNELFQEFYTTFNDLAVQYGFDANRDKAQYDFLKSQVEKQVEGMVKSRAKKKVKERQTLESKKSDETTATTPSPTPKPGSRRLRRCTRTRELF